MDLLATNPLIVTAHAPANARLPVSVDNPSGEPFRGRLVLQGQQTDGWKLLAKTRLELKDGQTHTLLLVSAGAPDALAGPLRLCVADDDGRQHCQTDGLRLVVVDDFARYTAETLAEAYQVVPDGDAKVASSQSLAPAEPKAGPPLPGAACLRVRYEMAKGWKFVRLAPRRDELRTIEGKPKQFALWLHGDGSGHSPRLRFRDTTGQTFQPAAEPIRWKGWKCALFPMDGRHVGHWGGANDGIVHYPISWDTLLLIDKDRDQAGKGEVYVASPTLMY